MDKKQVREFTAKQLFLARNNILYFAENVKTHDANTKLILPFPVHKKYIREVLKLASTAQRLAIYKSRQMMITWSMCIVILWELLFYPGTYVGLISKKEEDAGKVLERIKLIYENLPLHWRVALPTPKWYHAKKGIAVRMVLNHPNGKPVSAVQAYPSGEDQVRLETFSLVYWDEVGFCPDLDARRTYGGLKPTLNANGRLLMSSTPPLNEEHFWHQLCSGNLLGN